MLNIIDGNKSNMKIVKDLRRRTEKNIEEQQEHYKRRNFIIHCPIDIVNWLSNPNKKEYYQLMRKYHPDKNENKDNDYAKFITSYWDDYSKTTYTKVHKSP